jgi:hypothetical protein
MVPSTVDKSSSTINCRNEVLLDRCELMKREDLVLLDGAEHKKTWYLLDGAEHNKTRLLLAGDDCDGVGRVKVCARTG